MSTVTLPNVRIMNDVRLQVTLKDSGVAVDWSDVVIKSLCMYSEKQKTYAGSCTYTIDSDDHTVLHVLYPAEEQYYLGDYRLIASLEYEDDRVTYDAEAFTMVGLTEDVEDDTIEVEDIEVGIQVSSIDTSILSSILAACQQATDDANTAAGNANTKANLADQKATAANTAATAANTAATAANTAATAANTAATAANTAATAANTAATAANTATENANIKIAELENYSDDIDNINVEIYGGNIYAGKELKAGYRLHKNGYWYAKSGIFSVIFDVSGLVGSNISFNARNLVNFDTYAFVDDYSIIETGSITDAEAWAENKKSAQVGAASTSTFATRSDILVPAGANYLIVWYASDDQYMEILVDTATGLKSDVSECKQSIRERLDEKAVVKQGILGLGASFMRGNAEGTGTNNSWFHTLCSTLGVNAYNDAYGGTNICYHANRLASGTILGSGSCPISGIDAVLIMHSHNKDVYTLPSQFESYSASDYETNGVVPFSTTTGSDLDAVEYAKAFDYVIKKIKSLYNAYRTDVPYDSTVQPSMGQYIPKPCQIILCTHWHDARTIYNDSVRKLAAKWDLPLVQFDKKIGFTKDVLNPITGKQASLEFVGNVGGASPIETIGGVQYGWHPMCGSSEVYIQKKMASIAGESFEDSYYINRVATRTTDMSYSDGKTSFSGEIEAQDNVNVTGDVTCDNGAVSLTEIASKVGELEETLNEINSQPSGGGSSTPVVDNVTSTSTTSALSANQGRVLKELIDSKGTYSKPSNGVPKSDFDSSVQSSLNKADTALQSVPNTYRTSSAQDMIDSGKASKITKASSIPSGGFIPNVLYQLGSITGAVTFSLASSSLDYAEYMIEFETGDIAPTITWFTGVTWLGGTAPVVSANKKYYVSVLDNLAVIGEF